MHKLFEAIGQPRNYDISAQDGRHQESRKDEKQMNGNVKSSSLLEKRQREEEKQRAEKSEEWVGSTALGSTVFIIGVVQSDTEAMSLLRKTDLVSLWEQENAGPCLAARNSKQNSVAILPAIVMTAIVQACFSKTEKIYLA